MFGAGMAPAWLARAAEGNTSGRRKVLVALFQRGAADGPNVVVPYTEPAYYALRPTIAIPKKDVIDRIYEPHCETNLERLSAIAS